MSKEYLEALEKVYYGSQGYGNCDENYKIVKQALQRLEALDNANPSEALECLERIGAEKLARGELIRNDNKLEPYTATIKQALLKAEKEHNSVNLLMQELDCKDFADLRKYARCGYDKMNEKLIQ